MTTRERFALGSLLAVMAGGHLLRLTAFAPKDAPGGMTLAGVAPGDPARHRARAERIGRPLVAGERIDLNRAPAAELARLPRVGMDLAKAIVRDREERGRFESLADLDRVDRIGPGLLAAIGPYVTPGDTGRRASKRSARAVWPPAPGAPYVVDTGGARGRRNGATAGAPGVRIPLNSASQADLEKLPGIGPTRAKAILAYRQANGPFASVQDLEKVPGLPRRLVTQLAAQVMVP